MSLLPNISHVLALWGIIQQDLIDAEVDSSRFGQTTDQLLLLMQAVLESNAGVRPSQTQSRIYRSLRNLLDLLPRERKRTIVRGLRPLAAAESFPLDLLPGENTGSWSAVKSVLTAEITLSGLTRRRAVDPAREAEQKRRQEELGGMSLGEKLRQDVSLASIRAVLGHEISLFGQDGSHGVPVLDAPELEHEPEDDGGLDDSEDDEPPVHLDELESGS